MTKKGSCHIIFSFFIGASLLWLAVMMSALLCLLLSTGSVKRTRLISEESLFLRAHTLPTTRLRNMNTPTSFSRSRFKSCPTERFMINSGWKQTEKSAEPLFYELLRFSIIEIFFISLIFLFYFLLTDKNINNKTFTRANLTSVQDANIQTPVWFWKYLIFLYAGQTSCSWSNDEWLLSIWGQSRARFKW